MSEQKAAVSPSRYDSPPMQPRRDDAVGRVHLLDYVRVLYRRRWTAVTAIFVVLLGVTVYAFTAVPVYQAHVQILIESENPNVVSFEEVLDEGQAQANYYQTQYQLLRSRGLARKTVDALRLAGHPQFGGVVEDPPFEIRRFVAETARAAVASVADLLPRRPVVAPDAADDPDGSTESAAQRAAVDALLAGLQVSPVRNTRLVDIRFRGPDATMASVVANEHARQYIEQSLELRFLASKEATDWLGARLAEERERVEESEAALQTYRETNDAVSLDERQDIVVQALADLNAAVTAAEANRIQKEARYNQLLSLKNDEEIDTFPAILSNDFVQQLKTELARLQREHVQLSGTLGDRHPDLIDKRSAIEATQRRLDAEIERVVLSVRNEYLAAQAEESSLVAALESQKREAEGLNRRGIQYRVLQREAESVRQIYETLLQRAKETGVSGELRASNIRIVDTAEPPRGPVSPRKGLSLLMGLLAGSMLGVGLAFFFEYLDDRIKTPDEMKTHLRIPFLGLLPEVHKASLKAKKSGTSLVSRDGSLMIGDAATPQFTEALRTMRTNVLFSTTAEGTRSLLVTSTSQGEGKTLVVSNLAASLARARQRVLLMDADLRRPRVHSVFGKEQGPGLSEFLVGKVQLSEVLLKTTVKGLQVLPAGTIPPNAPELLGSGRFVELMDALESRFDWVLIDTPPVMAVTDACVVAHRTNGVILVVAADMTGRRAARLAVGQIESAGGHLIGSVLNRADLDHHSYYYSPYYRREYSQGYLPNLPARSRA